MNATDLYLQVVFKGTLGAEDNAVAVGFKDISEPTPIDVLNNMDRICLNGAWYVAGSPEAIAQVDTNHDGIAWGPQEWDVYAHDLRNIYVRFSSSSNMLAASSTNYNFNISSIPAAPGGSYARVYVLTDYDFYESARVSMANTTPNDFWVSAFPTSGSAIPTVKNQTEYSEPAVCYAHGFVGDLNTSCYIRYYPPFISVRGMYVWNGFLYENGAYPSGSTCP